MIKNLKKLLAFLFIILLSSITPVFAKEMTLNELGNEIEKYNKDAESAYIIGNYVFTSAHKLTTQDIMLAAKSINTTVNDGEKGPDAATKVTADEIYGKMTINMIKRKYDANWAPIGWEVPSKNIVVGNTELKLDNNKNKIDIRYIDYNYIAKETPSKVELIANTDTTYKEVIKKYFTKLGKQDLEISTDSTDEVKYLEGLLLKTTTLNDNVFNTEEKTGYYFALALKVPGATAKTKTTIKVKGAKTEKEFTYDNFDVTTADEAGIALLYSVDPDTKDSDKKITITIDFDGSGKEYAAKTYTIDYSRLKFQEDSGMKIDLESLNKEAKDHKTFADLINESFSFVGNREVDGFDKLTLTKENDKTYKLKGSIFQEKTKYNGLDKADVEGYFFSLVLTAMDGEKEFAAKKSGVTITDDKTIITASAFDTDSSIGLMKKLDDKCAQAGNKEKCKFTLTIDNDGNSNKYLPVEYTVDYSEVTFVKNSLITVKDISSEESIKTKLKDDYGWVLKDGYKTNFTVADTNPNLVKVNGLIPIIDKFEDNKTPFSGEAKTGYYLAFTIHTNIAKQNSTTVKIVHSKDNSTEDKTATGSDFDTSNDIYVLKHLHPNDSNKTFDIVIDIDGEKKEYAPYTLTVDWSGLNFQEVSSSTNVFLATGSETTTDSGYISKEDKQQLEEWGYSFEKAGTPLLTATSANANYKLTGSVKQQKVSKAGFEDDTGYYVALKVFGPTADKVGKENINNWTVQFKNEKGLWMNAVTPSKTDYTNGFITVLIKLKEDTNKISYKIDFDGNKNNYLPYEVVIDYSSDFVFIPYYNVTFEYFNNTGTLKKVIDQQYKGELINTNKVTDIANFAYHTFDEYWIDKATGEKFALEKTPLNSEITLKAHYTINESEFVKDVIADLNKNDGSSLSPNYDDKLEFKVASNNIIIEVKDYDIKISKLKDVLAGTIAYILNKEEIGSITFDIDGNSEKFTKESLAETEQLKEKIKSKLTKVFTTALATEDETLNNMAIDNKQFTLSFENLAKSVKLSNDLASLVYTFNFKTESAIVMNEEQLKKALTNDSIKNIDIGTSFAVKQQHDITRSNITIKSSSTKEINTLTGNSIETIFDIKGNNININNLNLTGSKSALTVEAGASVIVDKVDFNNVTEEGVLVKGNGSFTGTNLKYASEKYMKPLVKAGNNSTVNVTRDETSKAEKVTIQKVTKYAGNFSGDTYFSDTLEADPTYNDVKHYFLNPDIKNRWIEVTFSADRTITQAPCSYRMYYDKDSNEEYLPEPKNAGTITQYKDNLATFNVSSWSSTDGHEYPTGQIKIPTTSTSYIAKYTASYDDSTVDVVSDETQLNNALTNSNKKYIVVKNKITLENILTISRPVTLIGSESGSKEIKGSIEGEIVIAAEGVLFDEIKIIGKKIGDKSPHHVITVKQKKFRSDESEYSIEDEDSSFASIIYYEIEEPTTTLFYNKFNANVATYIEFNKTVDGMSDTESQVAGSSVIGNLFYDKTNAKTFITINKIKAGTTLRVNQNDLYLTPAKNATFINIKAHAPSEKATLQVSSIFLADKESSVDKTKIVIDNTLAEDASGLIINTYKSTAKKFEISYSGSTLTAEKAVQLTYNDKT